MADRGDPDVRRVVLHGDRFRGGRLPVDALVELERYQELVRTLARFEWEAQHDGEDTPASFDDSVGLTITRLGEGSADLTLVLDRPEEYAPYVDDSADVFADTLRAAYDGGELPELDPAIRDEFRALVAQFGSTLDDGDSITVHEPHGAPPITVTPEKRARASERLLLDAFLIDTMPPTSGSDLHTEDRTLIGRFTAIDADRQAFVFKSFAYGALNGSYSDHAMTGEITKLVESSDLAPITRVVCALQYRNRRAWRIRETRTIERFDLPDDAWGNRLYELAALADGWGDAADGRPIAVEALEAARDLLRAIDQASVPHPAVFPTTGGGVLIEWATRESVRSIEITADAAVPDFELFELITPAGEPTFVETRNFVEARNFAVAPGARRRDD